MSEISDETLLRAIFNRIVDRVDLGSGIRVWFSHASTRKSLFLPLPAIRAAQAELDAADEVTDAEIYFVADCFLSYVNGETARKLAVDAIGAHKYWQKQQAAKKARQA